MGLLKSLKKKNKPVFIGQVTNLILGIDKLKNSKLLEVSDRGVFYTYPEVVYAGNNPEAFCRNLYIYGRATGLLAIGQELTLRHNDTSEVLAIIDANIVNLSK